MSHDTNLVVIGVPVYNGEKFIKECLESILNQTYKNWECHIVNNCSKDATQSIAESFVNMDKRFKLFNYEEFVPVEKNWNRTTEHIPNNCKYFKLVQADDWITSDYLSKMVKLLDTHDNVGMCTSYRINGYIVDCDGLRYEDGPVFNGKNLLERHLMQEIEITGSITTLLFRLNVLKQVPGYPKIFDETDFHFDTHLAYHAMNLSDVGFIYQVLSYTRWHDNALTTVYCVKHNTFFDGYEKRLYNFRSLSDKVSARYVAHRLNYAYFLLKQKALNRKETLIWHKQNMTRPITNREYIKSLILLNGISYRLRNFFKKTHSNHQ